MGKRQIRFMERNGLPTGGASDIRYHLWNRAIALLGCRHCESNRTQRYERYQGCGFGTATGTGRRVLIGRGRPVWALGKTRGTASSVGRLGKLYLLHREAQLVLAPFSHPTCRDIGDMSRNNPRDRLAHRVLAARLRFGQLRFAAAIRFEHDFCAWDKSSAQLFRLHSRRRGSFACSSLQSPQDGGRPKTSMIRSFSGSAQTLKKQFSIVTENKPVKE